MVVKQFKFKKRAGSKGRWRDRAASALFLAPSFCGVSIFYIIPFFVVGYYAFLNSPISGQFVGFDNFVALFQNDSFLKAAKNTATFSCMAVPAAVILSLLLALLLDSKIPGKSKFRAMFLFPMMVPVASVVLIWQVLFSYNGAFNSFLAVFGVQAVDWLKSDYSQLVALLLFLWKNLGYNMILFMSGLGNIPGELLEVAQIEGCGPVYTFFAIKLRFLSPTILFVTIMSLINSFKVFREIYLLTGDYPYGGLYMLQHFMNNMFASLDYPKLAAGAIVMAVVMVAIIAVLFVAENKFGKGVEG